MAPTRFSSGPSLWSFSFPLRVGYRACLYGRVSYPISMPACPAFNSERRRESEKPTGNQREKIDGKERGSLQPWAEQALTGGVLVVSPIRAALAQRLGRKVATSVVYRFLARHGWRKVAPDTRHPKSDPQIQEAWKKNSRKTWRPC